MRRPSRSLFTLLAGLVTLGAIAACADLTVACPNVGGDAPVAVDTVIAVGQTYTPLYRARSCGGTRWAALRRQPVTIDGPLEQLTGDTLRVRAVAPGVGLITISNDTTGLYVAFRVTAIDCHLFAAEPRRPSGGWCREP